MNDVKNSPFCLFDPIMDRFGFLSDDFALVVADMAKFYSRIQRNEPENLFTPEMLQEKDFAHFGKRVRSEKPHEKYIGVPVLQNMVTPQTHPGVQESYPAFDNGRHRSAYFVHHGATEIPMVIARDQVQAFLAADVGRLATEEELQHIEANTRRANKMTFVENMPPVEGFHRQIGISDEKWRRLVASRKRDNPQQL